MDFVRTSTCQSLFIGIILKGYSQQPRRIIVVNYYLFVSIDRSMKIQFGTSNWIRIFVIWGIHCVETSTKLKIPCSNCTVKPSNCTWSLQRKFSNRIVNIRIFNDFNFLVWWQWSQAKVDGFPAQEEFLNGMWTFRIQTWSIFWARNFAWNNFKFFTLN